MEAVSSLPKLPWIVQVKMARSSWSLGNVSGCWTAGGNQSSAGMSAVSIGREVESALPRNISWCKIKGPRKAYAVKLKLRKDKHRTQVGGKVIAEQNSV